MGILPARHTPRIDVILIEVPDEIGGYGAKGVGEIGCVATAPAVAAALHSYDRIRRVRGEQCARFQLVWKVTLVIHQGMIVRIGERDGNSWASIRTVLGQHLLLRQRKCRIQTGSGKPHAQ